jgi:hypothetical protein
LSGKRKKPILVFLVSLFIILLYFALFPYPLGKELVAKPAWVLNLSEARPMALSDGETLRDAAAFQVSGVFGYVAGNGELVSLNRPLFRVALTRNGFVNYSRVGTTWFFQDPRGERKFSFSGTGYPLLSRDAGRLFTVKSDLTGLSELDGNGGILWSRDFPCLMTSLSLEADRLLIGLLDGTLDLVDARGAITMEYAPMGSRIPVVLGCAVSRDGGLLAAVCGIDPQTLIVLMKEAETYRVLSHVPLSSDFRQEIRMGFMPDGGCLVFEGGESAELFDPRSRAVTALPLSGGLAAFAFMPARGAAALLGRDELKRELLIVKPFSFPLSREVFSARSVFLGEMGQGFLLGMDTLLLRINLEET